ncbi:MAG: hypothetical protein CMH54_05840 [Myxococcales bacterium]|nr:hypothetical protein [Myxococcales bacterium]
MTFGYIRFQKSRSVLPFIVWLFFAVSVTAGCVSELEKKVVPDGYILKSECPDCPDIVVSDVPPMPDIPPQCPGVSDCKTLGICAEKTVVECIDGEWVCDYSEVTGFEPDGETLCDGLDNDCDGVVDDGLTDVAQSDCRTEGVCAGKTKAICSDGSWICDYSAVDHYDGQAESRCDGFDNDCDGEVDEGIAITDGPACPNKGVCLGFNQSVCVDGVWECDFTFVFHEEEEVTCDNLDNDCDGETDEDIVVFTAGVCPADGVCAEAEKTHCVDGALVCDLGAIEGYEGPAELSCDGIDNNCDGSIDEDITEFPGIDVSCIGLGVCATPGYLVCQNGSPVCSWEGVEHCIEGEEGTEPECYAYEGLQEISCDGADNNCDGQADNDIIVENWISCSTQGVCGQPGTHIFKRCADPSGPNAKTFVCDYSEVVGFEANSMLWEPGTTIAQETSCDGLDNDCDGETDEEIFDTGGTPLGCKSEGQCASGLVVGACTAEGQACDYTFVVGYEEEETLCDGLDNDCDGAVDENITDLSASTCRTAGICDGTVNASCDAGSWACDYTGVAGYEDVETTCDGIDNDCDGLIDEQIVDLEASDCKNLGVCSAGVSAVCVNGDWNCSYGLITSYQGNHESLCDGLDNDCDGDTDESSCGVGEPCITGAQCVSSVCLPFPGNTGPGFCANSTTDCIASLPNGTASITESTETGCVSPTQLGSCLAGSWTPGSVCSDIDPLNPVCADGSCLNCEPNRITCDDQTILACAADGSGFSPVVDCPNGQSCFGTGYCALTGELLTNTITTGDQIQPDIATATNGDYLIVWATTTTASGPGSSTEIAGRWFHADGCPYGTAFNGNFESCDPVAGEDGGEFVINSTTLAEQSFPAVAINSEGKAMVTWMSLNQDGNGEGVFGRLVDGTGPLGDEFQVNTFSQYNQNSPTVIALTDGSFVVSWVSDHEDGDLRGIVVRVFDSNGNPITDNIVANSYVTNFQVRPTVAALQNGGFVAAWASFMQDNPGLADMGTFLQVFDSKGNRVGGEVHANQETNDNQDYPACASVSANLFLCSWVTDNQDGAGSGIYGRLFANDGNPIGDEFQINSSSPGNQAMPYAFSLGSGGAGVAWQADVGISDSETFVRYFNGLGIPIGDDAQLNVTTSGSQQDVRCAGAPQGQAVCTWMSQGQDGSQNAIIHRFTSQ